MKITKTINLTLDEVSWEVIEDIATYDLNCDDLLSQAIEWAIQTALAKTLSLH